MRKTEGTMQRGTIKSFDKSSGAGIIGRDLENDVRFFSENIVGRGRGLLEVGDRVMFEVENINSRHIAINVRKQ
jgi:cold shock CspA family protein